MKLCSKYLVFIITIFTFSAQATLISHHDEASFTAAIAALNSTTVNFDSMSQGDIIASGDSVDGITFDYDLGGFELMVDDLFDTTSPTNYLGVDDGGDGIFLGGDSFIMTFASAQRAIGLYIHTADFLFDDDISITTNSGSTSLIAVADLILSDGDAYFIGLTVDTDAEAFTSVNLSSLNLGFAFNVDDITYASARSQPPNQVPEPATMLLMFFALTVLTCTQKQRFFNHPTFTLER